MTLFPWEQCSFLRSNPLLFGNTNITSKKIHYLVISVFVLYSRLDGEGAAWKDQWTVARETRNSRGLQGMYGISHPKGERIIPRINTMCSPFHFMLGRITQVNHLNWNLYFASSGKNTEFRETTERSSRTADKTGSTRAGQLNIVQVSNMMVKD